MYVGGIDEAGRGCVIGPLVIGGFLIDENKIEELEKLGVKDSKLLSPAERARIAKELRRNIVWTTKEISANEITQKMGTRSLNEEEARVAGKITNEFAEKIGEKEIKEIIVDAPDTDENNFSNRIKKYLKFNVRIRSEHKADLNYLVVGAASILAKTRRDAQIEKIKKLVGEDFGSGYSSDERTISFLKKSIRKPELQEFLRHKWKTAKELKTFQADLSKFV